MRTPHSRLIEVHNHLMQLKFPYCSVSVVYQYGCFKVMFMDYVKDKVSIELKSYLDWNDFEYTFVKD